MHGFRHGGGFGIGATRASGDGFLRVRAMKVSLGILLVLLTMLLSQLSPAQAQTSNQPAQTFSGCLTSANGLLLLKQQGGHTYALNGHTEQLNKYLDHIVQVQGTPEKPQDAKLVGAALRVKVYKVGSECKLGLHSLSRATPEWKKSGEPAVPVAGKAGQAATAVPVTSNRSVGETTPPSDVNRNRVPPQPSRQQPGQPPVPEDTAQNPADADRIAVAAQRAEIGTHNGTIGVPAQPGTGTLSTQQQSARRAAVVQIETDGFQPAKVTVAPGQAVEWKNDTGDPHTVTLVPDKALVKSDASLPRNAQPFDSGTISAGMTFTHAFTAPGIYRYFCTLHEGNGMVGEVIVK